MFMFTLNITKKTVAYHHFKLPFKVVFKTPQERDMHLAIPYRNFRWMNGRLLHLVFVCCCCGWSTYPPNLPPPEIRPY